MSITVSSGSTLFVSAGMSPKDKGDVILGGGTEEVISGGVASTTTIEGTSGLSGIQIISGGGEAINAVVSAFGSQSIISGGLASGTTVSSGGTQFVSAGGSAFATAVRAGGVEIVSGGLVSGTTVFNSGQLEVEAGGSASSTIIRNGGVLTVGGGGTANGVQLSGGSAEIQSGGTLGSGLSFASGGSTLTIDPGAIISGGVSAASGSTGNILELGSGSTAGVISGFNGQFSGYDTLRIDGGASWELAGTTTIDGALNNRGTLTESSGDNLTISGSVTGGGSIVLDPSTLTLDSGVAAGQTVRFVGGDNVLNLEDPSGFAGTLASFGGKDTIDLGGVTLSSVTGLGFNSSTDVLSIYTSGGGSIDLQFQGNLSGRYFHDAVDVSGGGIFITQDTTPCYCPGSLILTPCGEVAVEQLAIGDWVTTHSGEAEPIKWIGRRSYAGRFLEGKPHILPVRIKANALADGVPKRDLWVSPLHAFYLDGCLIPAGELINGISIIQEPVDRVDYIHLELASHALVWAEGAASETFVDDNSRMLFENADEYDRLYPDETRQAATFCAERLSGGLEVDTIRWRLADRAAALFPASDSKAA